MPLHRSQTHRSIVSSLSVRTLKRPEGRAPGQCTDAPAASGTSGFLFHPIPICFILKPCPD